MNKFREKKLTGNIKLFTKRIIGKITIRQDVIIFIRLNFTFIPPIITPSTFKPVGTEV